jgi:phage-related protein
VDWASRKYEQLVNLLGLDPIGEAVRLFEDGVARIKASFDGLLAHFRLGVATLRQIGANLIDGLWAGISERWEALKAKVAAIANSVTGVFRSEVKSESPSRVFMDIGRDLMSGLQLGIQSGAAAPFGAMRGAAAALAIGATALPSAPALAATARPASGISMPITITIQAPAGADAQALAALVRREVAGATQTAAGRIARLYDTSDGF